MEIKMKLWNEVDLENRVFELEKEKLKVEQALRYEIEEKKELVDRYEEAVQFKKVEIDKRRMVEKENQRLLWENE